MKFGCLVNRPDLTQELPATLDRRNLCAGLPEKLVDTDEIVSE